MKKLLALMVLLGLLGACHAAPEEAENTPAPAELNKAEQIAVLAPDSGETVATITDPGEIDAFVTTLEMDSWQPDDLPEGAKPAGAFALSQEETVHPGQSEAAGRYDVGRITVYDADYVELEIAGVPMTFSLPAQAAAHLRGYVEGGAA